ncbi:MAG TPA: TIGR03617 family F420-dependent LLM class oxidoreductase, partial [Ilumatobacteraceae bacterium]
TRGLPSLMRVDVMTFPRALHEMGEVARDIEAAGFGGVVFTEGGRTAYLSAAVTATAAPALTIATGVAVAFPRSPMVTAQIGWELQEATSGKFRLGLGTQVRAHIVRRFSAEFDHPGPRLRDYVLAVKSSFAAFAGGALDHRGPYYELTFITPQWSPGAIAVPAPPIDIAAVNPWMLRMAGEVADGVHVHPIGEPGYIRRTVLPAIAEGAVATGRNPAAIELTVPVMCIVGDTDDERAHDREHMRAMIAFYGTTPNYAFIFDQAGFEGTTARLREKQKAGDVAAMTAQITDDHLAVFAVESTWDGLAGALRDRCTGLTDHIVLYNAIQQRERSPERFRRYGEVARALRNS